jgi:hypothetical protein
MSFCRNCGSELKPEIKFCEKCGTPVPAALDIPGLKPVKRARLNWLPWAVAGFTAVYVLFFGWFIVMAKVYGRNPGNFKNKNSVTEKVSPEIKVYDAVNERFSSERFGDKTMFAYPEISIEGENTDSANAEIEKDLGKYCKGNKLGKYAAQYTYYISENVVSILVEMCRTKNDPRVEYYVYNISIETGKLLKDEELITLYGTTDEDFFEKVKETYNSYYKDGKITQKEKDDLLKEMNYRNLYPYIGKNGHLCFAVSISKEDESSEDVIFDTNTKKPLTGLIDI